MNTYYYTLLFAFSIIAVMTVIDDNVGIYFLLLLKILKVNTERLIWMIRFHPNNFIMTWIQNRKYNKIAKELEEEFRNRLLNDNETHRDKT